MGKYQEYAEPGKHYVLTEYGYQQTPDEVKKERKAGESVKGFEYKVPASWIKKGYVVIKDFS